MKTPTIGKSGEPDAQSEGEPPKPKPLAVASRFGLRIFFTWTFSAARAEFAP
jgi:hypothetical protein